MPNFSYQASDKTGKLIRGVIEADSEDTAIARLRDMNYLPIRLSTSKERGEFKFPKFSIFKGVRENDIMIFTQELSTLLGAGIPLDKSLTILIELTDKKRLKNIVIDVQKNIHSGSSFADALSRHPNAFSPLYVQMVRAGESGGVLEPILKKIAEFLENSAQLKEAVFSAMIYPILLTLVSTGAVTILLTYVVPKFAKIFVEMGQVIPLPTQILLNISAFLTGYILYIISGMVLSFFLFNMYISTKKGKELYDLFKLKLPLIGSLIKKIEVSRFSRTLGTLTKSGVPILKSLEIVADVISNTQIAKVVTTLHSKLKRGGGMSEPLKGSKFFPSMAVHMITVGEETGRLDDMLIKVADTYDREVAVSVKKLTSLIEPFMILFMGLIVGFIVISMLMAIFSINDIPL